MTTATKHDARWEWDDDDRSLRGPLPGSPRTAPPSPTYYPVTKIIKEYLQEEKAALYCHSPRARTPSPPRNARRDWYFEGYAYSDSSPGYRDLDSDIEEEAMETETGPEAASSSSVPQDPTMDKVLEKQIYKKFSYL